MKAEYRRIENGLATVSFHTISKTVTFLPPTKELEKARLAFRLGNIIQFVVKKDILDIVYVTHVNIE